MDATAPQRPVLPGRQQPEAIIEVRGLTKRFGRQIVFDALKLDVYRGEILGVVGGSGQGKSVLLRSIIGLLPPEAGRIMLFGRDVYGSDDTQTQDLQTRTAYYFQDGALFSALTVLQNVQVPMREHFSLPQKILRELRC